MPHNISMGQKYFISLGLFFSLLFQGCFAGKPESKYSATSQAQQVEQQALKIDQKYENVPQISAGDLLKNPQKWILVDTRDKNERAVSILAGSMDLEKFEAQASSFKDRTILFYCTIGERSSTTAEYYIKKGYSHVANLRGGILAWAHAGGEFVDGQGNITTTVHVYAEPWNLLPENYTGVW